MPLLHIYGLTKVPVKSRQMPISFRSYSHGDNGSRPVLLPDAALEEDEQEDEQMQREQDLVHKHEHEHEHERDHNSGSDEGDEDEEEEEDEFDIRDKHNSEWQSPPALPTQTLQMQNSIGRENSSLPVAAPIHGGADGEHFPELNWAVSSMSSGEGEEVEDIEVEVVLQDGVQYLVDKTYCVGEYCYNNG